MNPPAIRLASPCLVSFAVAALACAALLLFLGGNVYDRTDSEAGASTDFQIELQQVESEIARNVKPTQGSDDTIQLGNVADATRLAYLLYRRAPLLGGPADFRKAEAGADEAIRRVGPTIELCLLKAHLDLRSHQLPQARVDLDMASGAGDTLQGRTLKADLDLQEGQYEQARRAYEAIIATRRTWDGLARLAHLESKLGDAASADRLYAEAEDEITAKEMRSYAWVELQRGQLDMDRGRHAEALAHYRLAEKAYSGFWLVDEHIAEVLAAQGKADEALVLYRKVVEQSPRPEAYQALGDLYALAGQSELARPWHEMALAGFLESAERGEVQYFHHLASFYADVRQNGCEAVKWAMRDLELRENYTTYAALAWALYCAARFEEAQEAIGQALSSGVSDAHMLGRAAMIHLASGRAEEGRKLLARAREMNPHFERFHIHR